MKTDIHLKFA